eukprot:5359458-Amphidinium_carterae.1
MSSRRFSRVFHEETHRLSELLVCVQSLFRLGFKRLVLLGSMEIDRNERGVLASTELWDIRHGASANAAM